MTHGEQVVGYIRVSTEEQGERGAGLAAQRKTIATECKRRGWRLMRVYEEVASGKSMNGRSQLRAAIAAVEAGEAAGLIAAKVDRLSRSVIDFSMLLDRAQRSGWNLVVLDLGVDLSTPMGEAMAQMVAVFAQLERRLIGQRTRDALAVRREQGVRLGRPVSAVPEALRRRIRRLHAGGRSYADVAELLNAKSVPSPGGAQWHATSTWRVAQTRSRE